MFLPRHAQVYLHGGNNIFLAIGSNASGGGNVIVFDTHHCMIQTPQNKLVVLQGMEDFIVVDTNDVLLICKREKEQDIKEYVAEVKRNKGDKYL